MVKNIANNIKKEDTLIGRSMRLTGLAALALAVVVFTTNASDEEGKATDATFRMESTSIAVGIGVTWGKGELSYQGKTYKFNVTGLTIVDVGVSKATASGRVFDLKKLEDFNGKYMSAQAGFALGGGIKGVTAKNDRNVVVDVTSTQQGVEVSIAPGGFSVELEK